MALSSSWWLSCLGARACCSTELGPSGRAASGWGGGSPGQRRSSQSEVSGQAEYWTCKVSICWWFDETSSLSPLFCEQVQIGEGWLDDDGEVVSLVPPAVDERADLLHISVQEAGHLLPGQWSPSKPSIQTGTDPAMSDVTEWMFVIHVLNIETWAHLTTDKYFINTKVIVISINGTKLMNVLGSSSRSMSKAWATLIM